MKSPQRAPLKQVTTSEAAEQEVLSCLVRGLQTGHPFSHHTIRTCGPLSGGGAGKGILPTGNGPQSGPGALRHSSTCPTADSKCCLRSLACQWCSKPFQKVLLKVVDAGWALVSSAARDSSESTALPRTWLCARPDAARSSSQAPWKTQRPVGTVWRHQTHLVEGKTLSRTACCLVERARQPVQETRWPGSGPTTSPDEPHFVLLVAPPPPARAVRSNRRRWLNDEQHSSCSLLLQCWGGLSRLRSENSRRDKAWDLSILE